MARIRSDDRRDTLKATCFAFAERVSSDLARRAAEAEKRAKRKRCPCEFGNPCCDNCTCANGHLSGGCSRCARYGSPEQQQAAADGIIASESRVRELEEALGDAIDAVCNGKLISVGDAYDTYEVRVEYLRACKWRVVLDPANDIARAALERKESE